ncbi:hypothetical protein N7478_009352 [Penicillium angulare]|uniref:uncharacterized protein n=1 Tax=Penicillium angulare TaxID=116970 RepID=UPI002540D283|nr:uncharacterized protein N7478_009352 [Penicillium angulare]KAJ5266544.1 hypothetical protein N7478_009352 [Penicillium angulare]
MVLSHSTSTAATTQDSNPNLESSSLTCQPIIYYPRNSDDAIAVLNIFNEILPSELGLSILHHAEYWLLSRVSRKHTIAYNSDTGRDRHPYLQSNPIQGNNFPVKKIIIDIWSHDQEFNYYFESGTDNYEDSPTWFDVGIERPSGREELLSDTEVRIVENVYGSAKTKHHRIVYRGDQDSDQGVGHSWMRQLRADDRVSIIPQARFLGWKNFVEGAVIEVYTDSF